MTVCKKNGKRFNNAISLALFAVVMSIFAACGGDSDSPSQVAEKDDGREVATVVDMGRCSSEREGDTVYVAEKMKDYLCRNRTWVDLSEISDNESSRSSSSVVSDKTSAASGKSSSSSVVSDKISEASGKTSSSSVASNTSSATSNASKVSSSSNKTDSPQNFIRENISVTGVAQKGPFKFGSPLNLYELKNDLNPSGRVYKDEINSNKGDFVIPKVSLAYPYAKLEVRGLYRNEVTGEWSKDSMTLRALTDFSDKRAETNSGDRAQVNINLLTHLEYDRALYLVQEKGYSVFAAKKQAAQEIMTAFEFATAVTYSEDFAIFQNDGVGSGTIAGNGTLLAVSALVMGNRSDAEIQCAIDKFREDVKTDGEWNDLQTKADMADWAYGLKYDNIRASVKSWNILDIPDYETYLDVFWNNVFGLGGCSVNRKDVVVSNSNKLSKYYGNYFTCKLNGAKYSWQAATTYEKDTYGWNSGKNGGFKKGNVTDSIYVYNGSKWEFSEIETAIGLCQKSNAGVVSKFNSVYYICRDNAWEKATMLEFDTYGLTGVEGDVKAGIVNMNYYYVYKDGKWQSATSIEKDLGGCVASREGEVGKSGDFYYICKSKTWASATSIEKDLGGCLANREGEVSKSGDYYYICKSKIWAEATALEYDTYGENCTNAEVGMTIAGVVTSTNKYYCTANGWMSLMDGWNWNVPKEARLNPEITYGTMTDSRDNKKYKTVIIGDQVWMAENLNYADSAKTASLKGNNWCYNKVDECCDVVGRLYTWAAAMDSVKTYCGYDLKCSRIMPVQGVCPTGWHLPSLAEWRTLITAVGGSNTAGKVLKSQTGWEYGNGTDAVGFSALPAGIGDSRNAIYGGSGTLFWSSTEGDNNHAYSIGLGAGYEVNSNPTSDDKRWGYSVRCIKDEE